MVARRILVPPVGVRIPPRQQTQPSGCVLSYIDPAPGATSFRGVGRAPDGSHTVQWSDAAPRCRHTSGWCTKQIYSKLVGPQKFCGRVRMAAALHPSGAHLTPRSCVTPQDGAPPSGWGRKNFCVPTKLCKLSNYKNMRRGSQPPLCHGLYNQIFASPLA